MMTESSNTSRLAGSGAKSIYAAYVEYRTRFDKISARAGRRFIECDWHGMRSDRTERLDLYRHIVDHLETDIRGLLQDRSENKSLWVRIKAIYAGIIDHRPDRELAETFFNSVTRRIFVTIGVDPEVEFVSSRHECVLGGSESGVYQDLGRFTSAASMVRAVLSDTAMKTGIVDLEADVELTAAEMNKSVFLAGLSIEHFKVLIISKVFYRGRRAFVIGCLSADTICQPLVIAMMNTPDGVIVDGVLTNEDDVSVLFSFTRAYFHVSVDVPCELVGFLKTILPKKRVAELYIALGFHKHGKTEFYRELLGHLTTCGEDRFQISPGTPGMVMVVFNMPAHDLVFKLIRDHFGSAKQTTRREVMDKYALVFKHHRAGRLVDAQSFEYLKFETCCFSEELLEELRQHAASTVEIGPDHLIISHAYVQRRVIPLDIYLQNASDEDALRVTIDFGNAIRELALSNIFAGDFLLKNFGVTRHGRVVFYDYDEICSLSQCNFKKLPQAHHFEDELSSEPWFLIDESDVFPEEFRRFLPLPPNLMNEFLNHHADLFEIEFWRDAQQAVNGGELTDIVPFPTIRRLNRNIS